MAETRAYRLMDVQRGAIERPQAAGRNSSDLTVEFGAVHEPNPAWDSFVAAHPNGDIVQSSLWALTKTALGQKAYLLVLRDTLGAIAGGLLVLEYVVKKVVRTGIVSKGPLARDNHLRTLEAVVEALLAHPWRRGLAGLIIQPAEGGDHFCQSLADFGFRESPLAIGIEATARVSLQRDEADILAGFTASGRRHVRKGCGNGTVITASDDVAAFHALYSATAARKGFRPLSLAYFASQWRVLSPGKNVRILTAQHEGRTVAAIWLTVFGHTVTYKFPGWDSSQPTPRHLNEYLHWEAIRWAKSVGAKYYDFGGFNREAAENLAQGLPLPPGFEQTHNLFKYGFDPAPTLFPKAQVLIGGALITRLTAPAMARLFRSKAIDRLARRMRG